MYAGMHLATYTETADFSIGFVATEAPITRLSIAPELRADWARRRHDVGRHR